MALLQCSCSFCAHVFYHVTTPCEFKEDGTYGKTIECPVCSNRFIDTVNTTPDAHTECPGCNSNCGSSLGGGCGTCTSACGLKTLVKD